MEKTPANSSQFRASQQSATVNLQVSACYARSVLLGACLLGSMLAASSAVGQATAPKRYFEATFGLNQPTSTTFSSVIDGQSGRSSVSLDSGVLAGGSFGYYFNSKVAGELEYTWQRADANSFSLPGLMAGGEGDIASVTIMLNALRDWQIGKDGTWTFFAGAGLGIVQEVSSDYELGSEEISFDDSGFGFQGFVGVRKQLNENWYLSARLSHLIGGGYTVRNEVDADDRIDLDYDFTSLRLGVGFRF